MYPVPFFKKVSEIVEICQDVEALGFDSVWGNEHVTRQNYVKQKWKRPPRYIEPLTILSYVAAKTEKIRLGTAIIPLPLRDPVLLARQASALDNISQGRFILGVGLGAYREEFEKQNPRHSEVPRGEMLDEALEALTRLFREKTASFKGKYYSFSEIELSPKPFQDALPIYIGGNTSKSIRRAVKYGAGWLPAGLTPSEIEKAFFEIKMYSKQYRKDVSQIDVAPQLTVCVADSHEKAIRKYRGSQIYEHNVSLKSSTFKEQNLENLEERDLIGTLDEIIEKIEKYKMAGVDHLPALIFIGKDVRDALKVMKLFAKEVLPCFK